MRFVKGRWNGKFLNNIFYRKKKKKITTELNLL